MRIFKAFCLRVLLFIAFLFFSVLQIIDSVLNIVPATIFLFYGSELKINPLSSAFEEYVTRFRED